MKSMDGHRCHLVLISMVRSSDVRVGANLITLFLENYDDDFEAESPSKSPTAVMGSNKIAGRGNNKATKDPSPEEKQGEEENEDHRAHRPSPPSATTDSNSRPKPIASSETKVNSGTAENTR